MKTTKPKPKDKFEPRALARKHDLEELRFMRDELKRLKPKGWFKVAFQIATAIDMKKGLY